MRRLLRQALQDSSIRNRTTLRNYFRFLTRSLRQTNSIRTRSSRTDHKAPAASHNPQLRQFANFPDKSATAQGGDSSKPETHKIWHGHASVACCAPAAMSGLGRARRLIEAGRRHAAFMMPHKTSSRNLAAHKTSAWLGRRQSTQAEKHAALNLVRGGDAPHKQLCKRESA